MNKFSDALFSSNESCPRSYRYKTLVRFNLRASCLYGALTPEHSFLLTRRNAPVLTESFVALH